MSVLQDCVAGSDRLKLAGEGEPMLSHCYPFGHVLSFEFSQVTDFGLAKKLYTASHFDFELHFGVG